MFRWKKGLFALGTVLAAGVLAAVALGQEGGPIQMTATVTVRPDKAGTPSHPRGIEIVASGTVDTPSDTPLPVARSFDAWLPKGWLYNGAKHPACTLAKLSRGGAGACPPESIVGGGDFGHRDPGDGDSTFSRRPLTVINGGRTKMYFWIVLQNPARVQAAALGTITKLNSPRWSYRLHAEIPTSLQIVSGIPITLDFFRVKLGRSDWIATTHCPHDHRWRYHLRMTSTSGQVLDTGGSVACRS
jgi:hypothetical protein